MNEKAYDPVGANTPCPTVHDIIEAAGGAIVLSYEMRVSQFAIRQWLTRGVPERHWAMIARRSGIDLATIARASEAARRKKARHEKGT